MASNALDLSKPSDHEEPVGADYRSLEFAWSDQDQKKENRIRSLIGVTAVQTTVIVLLVVSVLYLTLFRAPKPYVLHKDKDGAVTFGGYLEDDLTVDDEMIPSQIMQFVEHWRTVTPDNTQQKRNVSRLYCMVTDRAPARARLNEYFRESTNDPFERNKTFSVTTEVRQISKLSGGTWQAEWYETTRAHDGRVEGTRETWRATMFVEKGEEQPDCLEGNPLGLYVQQLNWTQAR